MEQYEINKRLSIIKYLYMLGCDALLNGSPISKSTSVLNFHDAVESFFVLASEIVGVTRRNLNFMDYFEEIKLSDVGTRGRELTHKMQIEKLNRLRVNFKHLGILPNEEECNNLRISLDDFFVENTPKFCNVNFDKISLANAIMNGTVRQLVSEAEILLNSKDYNSCLSKLGRAFYTLICASENKTKTIFGKSAVFLSGKVDLFHSGLDFDMQHAFEDIINPAYLPLAEALNILILGVDYKKYAKFKWLTPYFSKVISGDIIEGGRPREFDSRFNINHKNAEFCYLFVVEAALRIEKFDFGLHSVWDKPDKVHVVDDKGVDLYAQEGKNKYISIRKIAKGTIVKFQGIGVNTPDGEFFSVEVNNELGYFKKGVKYKEIDNPELNSEGMV
jgi:hypothetical protein